MCGIVGFVDNLDKKSKKTIIKKMADRIIHRGPNSEGYYVDDAVALGFRRLSIIDIDGGSQPIYNETKDKVIIFNGEIYNFKELKKELIKKGHTFKTNTDTETIIHGYEEYGKDIVNKLRGMFAFVIWDEKTGEMFGARDPFGIKPFYYANMNGTFMIASEIKSMLEHPNFQKELNKEAIRPYLTFQFSALNETFFKGVYKLKPGHFFTYKDGKMDIEKYYTISFDAGNKSIDNYADEIGKRLDESIKYHTISDVKLGAFLSGGVDSSYVVAELHPNETFSVGFPRKPFNETDEAKELSDILKIKNTRKMISADEVFDNFEDIMYYCDEPHGNPSTLPLYFLAQLAAKDVTVVLSGEGADELFAGYDIYRVNATDLKYRKLVIKPIRYLLGKIAYEFPWFHGRRFLIRNGLPVEDYFTGSAFIFKESEKKAILNKEYMCGKTFKEITKPYFDEVKDKGDTTKMQYLDMNLWLPEDILLKADKMTMAHSLELRVPFLDKSMMEIAKEIPDNYKITPDTTKYVFRKTAYKKLPDEWAKRPKCGFPVPFQHWIKEDKYYNIVKTEFEQDYVKEFFNQKEIIKLLDEHRKGKVMGRKIYVIYAFLIWYKRYFIKEN